MKHKNIPTSLMAIISCSILLLTACSNAEKNPVYVNDYQSALKAKTAINLQQAGVSASWVSERFSGVMNKFKADDVESRARKHFAQNLYFNDTWHTFTDVESLGSYLSRTGDRVHFIEVLVDDVVISNKNAYVRWSMSFTIDAGDAPINSVGMTHLQFNAEKKIVVYQDYWDGIEGFYRTLPAIGPVLSMIRKRLG